MGTRAIRGIREGALWSGALLGLLAVAAGVAVTVFHVSFLVFRSGSMSPEIRTGALALARPVDAVDLRSGDIVSVRASDGSQITHRVVEITVRGDEASLVLQGDANTAPDAEVYTVRAAERVVVDAPYLGYVVAYALTPAGLVAMTSLCLMLLLVSGEGPDDEIRPRRGHRRGHRRAVTAMVVGGVAATGGVSGTWATFNDLATTTTGAFAARTLTYPTGVTCSNQFLASDYITWTAPAGLAPTGYRVHYSTSPSGPFTTVDVPPTPLRWQPPSATPYVTYYVYVAANRGSWSSVPNPAGDTIEATSIFGINYFSC